MELSVWQAVVLGVVQGLTEFLPVSSSAHLILVPWLFGWHDPGLAFDVALHAGTLLAVLIALGGDLWRLAVAALTRPGSPPGRLGWAIAIGTIPGALAGYFLKPLAEGPFRHPLSMAAGLALFGLLLWWIDRAVPAARSRPLDGPRAAGAVLWAGVAQALAVVPGVSRSGSTMAAARLAGLDRAAAARVSFLLAVPIILGALVFTLPDLTGVPMGVAFWAGLASSALVGYAAIYGLLRFVGRSGFGPFAVYRLAVAALLLVSWWRR